MLNKNNGKKLNLIINFIFYAIIFLLVILLLKYILPLIMPFLVALLLSMFLEPIIRIITIKTRLSKSVVSTLCILIVFSVIFLLIFLLITILIAFVSTFSKEIPELLAKLNLRLETVENKLIYRTLLILKNFIMDFKIEKLVTGEIGIKIFDMTSGVIKSIPSIVLSLLITVVSSILFSVSYTQIICYFKKTLPAKSHNAIVKIKSLISQTFFKYIKSYSLIIALTFIELSILLYLFGFKSPFAISAIISLIDILPILGTGTIFIPWIIINVIVGKYNSAIILASIYILVTVIRQIIEPRIIGKQIGLHPIVVLICVYIGLKTFGIIGVIIFPISVLIIYEIYKSYRLNLDNNIGNLYNS